MEDGSVANQCDGAVAKRSNACESETCTRLVTISAPVSEIRAPRGFGYVSAGAKRAWRLVVTAGAPALLVLLGLARLRQRDRPAVRP